MAVAVGTVALLIFEPHRWFEVPNPLIHKYVRVPKGTLTYLAVAVGAVTHFVGSSQIPHVSK